MKTERTIPPCKGARGSTSILLLCSGKGRRLGQPKASAKLHGKSLLDWNLELLKQLPFKHDIIIVKKGGKTRHGSVKMGLKKAKGEIVMIHNVANPMASVEDFVRIHEELQKHDSACFVGQKIVDTVRQLNDKTSTTIPRENLWRVQTPQGFRKKSLCKKMEKPNPPLQGGWGVRVVTDEITLFENSSIPIVAFETSDWNIKVTTKKDLKFLERMVRGVVRVGIGEDSHPFDTEGILKLGGVAVKGYTKLRANSDGDVILHALCNAIRSALGQGSFSEVADPMCAKGINNSSRYLHKILQHTPPCKGAGGSSWCINNVSISLTCTEPKIDPLVPKIKKSLSKLLDVEPHQIGITATSSNGVRSFKKGNGIRCQCIVTLYN